jgi:hypothetical protein
MKTGHLLYLANVDRDAFNTMKRRGHLPFLDRHTGALGLGDDSVDRFRPWHGLGLVALRTLQLIGVETPRASAAVDDSWSDITKIAGLLPGPPKTNLCGPRLNDIGLIDTWGWQHPKSKGGRPIASVSVDLVQLWDGMQAGLEEIEAQRK